MSVQICQHVKVDGTLCQVPPLDGRHYCHFHLETLGRRMRMARARARREPYHLLLPILEDINAVQVARLQVMDALAAGLLEEKRAGLLLYGLQGISSDLNSAAPPRLGVYDPAIDTAPRATEAAGFEEEYGLPPDIDLGKPPEVVFPPAAEPAITQPGPSPYRSKPFEHDYIAPQDVELEEIYKTQGPEAYQRREKELNQEAMRQVMARQREVQWARYVVEAARRNQERMLGTPEEQARNKAEVQQRYAEAMALRQAELATAEGEAGKKPSAADPGEPADSEAAQ